MKKRSTVYSSRNPNIISYHSQLNDTCYYNWGCNNNVNLLFIPMIWAGDSERMSFLTDSFCQKYRTILAFNEPDLEGQAMMTVKEALDVWPILDKKVQRLGSPACAKDPLKADSWLRQFMSNKPRVDFICLHRYLPPKSNGSVAERVANTIKWVDDIYKLFNKPIWITELGVISTEGSKSHTMDDTCAFMKSFMAECNKRSYVEKVIWKDNSRQDGAHIGDLFDSNNKITKAGLTWTSL